MDLAFAPEDLAFQQEVRDWIATAFDDDLRRKMAQSKNGYLDKAGQVKWQKALFERGWIAHVMIIDPIAQAAEHVGGDRILKGTVNLRSLHALKKAAGILAIEQIAQSFP